MYSLREIVERAILLISYLVGRDDKPDEVFQGEPADKDRFGDSEKVVFLVSVSRLFLPQNFLIITGHNFSCELWMARQMVTPMWSQWTYLASGTGNSGPLRLNVHWDHICHHLFMNYFGRWNEKFTRCYRGISMQLFFLQGWRTLFKPILHVHSLPQRYQQESPGHCNNCISLSGGGV